MNPKRLPPVDDTADPEAAAVFAEIRSTRGFVSNALRALGHSPDGLRRFAGVGEYVKYRSDLTERLRELTILCAARDVPYEWIHHRPLAIQAGIPEAVVADIEAGRVPSGLSPAEQAITQFISELATSGPIDDEVFASLREHWSPRQITDMALTATYYRALGALATAFGVTVETDEVLRTEQQWQAGR